MRYSVGVGPVRVYGGDRKRRQSAPKGRAARAVIGLGTAAVVLWAGVEALSYAASTGVMLIVTAVLIAVATPVAVAAAKAKSR